MGFFKNIGAEEAVVKEIYNTFFTKVINDYNEWDKDGKNNCKYLYIHFRDESVYVDLTVSSMHNTNILINISNINYMIDFYNKEKDNIDKILDNEFKFHKMGGCGKNYFEYK